MLSESFFSSVYTDEEEPKRVQELNLCHFSFKLNAFRLCQLPMPLLNLFIIIVTALSLILFIVGRIMPTLSPDLNKIAPYECGFDPIKSARLPFSFRFFLVAILFLIFDLEIALLLIIPLSTSTLKRIYTIPFLLTFIIILVLGLWYEWKSGGLEWAED